MAEKFDVDAILRANPHIDREEFERTREALEGLTLSDGTRMRQIPIPTFGGRRVDRRQNRQADHRSIRLRRSV